MGASMNQTDNTQTKATASTDNDGQQFRLTVGGIWSVVSGLSLGDAVKLGSLGCMAIASVFWAGAKVGPTLTNVSGPSHEPTQATSTVSSISHEPVQKKVYYGYYIDVQKDLRQVLNDETLELEFVGANVIRAEVSGIIELGGQKVHRTWNFAGYHNGTHIAMSYATRPDRDDPNPQ